MAGSSILSAAPCRDRGGRLATLLVAGATLLTLLAPVAPAAGQSAQLDEWLTQLNSPDFNLRQQATERMLQHQRLDEAAFEYLFAHARSHEQRHRLIDIARHHALARLVALDFPGVRPGSIGLSQHVLNAEQVPELGRPAVLVVSTFPGFPGYAHLRPGDLILSVNDQQIGHDIGPEHFAEMVKANPAGRPIRLQVVRDGERRAVTFNLASFEALSSMYEVSGGLRPIYEHRWRQAMVQLLDDSPLAQAGELTLDELPPGEPQEAAPIDRLRGLQLQLRLEGIDLEDLGLQDNVIIIDE